MRHPTDGTLRRLLDEPAGVLDADRAHVSACGTCLAELAGARHDARLAGRVLNLDPPHGGDSGTDLDTAWRRLSASVSGGAAPAHDFSGTPPADRRRGRGLRTPVLAAVGAAAILTGASAAAAGDWFQVFRTERVALTEATRAELVALPEPEELDAYGDVEVLAEPSVREVDGAAEAADVTGLPVPDVAALPRGVSGAPSLLVLDEVSAEFTFSAAEAARTVADEGETLPVPPAGLDGSSFRLAAGPGHASVWESGSGAPALVVARAVAPTAFSSGVPFDTAVGYLRTVPGVPSDLAGRLAQFADGRTLPLPFASDEVGTEDAVVGGVEATVVTSRDGTFAGVVWVDDGVVTVVAGSLAADEVLDVARGLRDR